MIAKAGRHGWWITTFPTHTRFYPQDPLPEEVHIEDIAWSLPMQARFLGHTTRHYSVGEHCCHVADVVWRETQDPIASVCALLHDGEETYVGDMPRPIKHYGPLAAYRSLGSRCTVVILQRFGLTEAYTEHEALIKRVDDELLHTESRRLNHGAGWEDESKIRTDIPIDLFAEQEVIDILSRDLPGDIVACYEKLIDMRNEALGKLMGGGAHGRWRREFMERFDRFNSQR